MRIIAMSDLHLSKKPWQVRKALKMCEGADAVLLVGDLVNDGLPKQLQLMQKCIAEILPDTPVFAVAGNHDYPRFPSPMIQEGIGDYPALQEWLLTRQSGTFILDNSGAWTVPMDKIEVIGLNSAAHWRRFKFPNGAQLKWLENHLNKSTAEWHIIMCHAPLLAHNPKRSDTKPYLSRDEQLQNIIDHHEHVIFISGHTHISMSSPIGCVEHDKQRNNIYINDGSIRPTTLLGPDGRGEEEPSDGNIVEIVLSHEHVCITAISMMDGRSIIEKEMKV